MNKPDEIKRLKPIEEFSKSHRHLPHCQLPGSVYFITIKYKYEDDEQPESLSDKEMDIVMESIRYLDEK